MLRQLYLFFFLSTLSVPAYAEDDIRYYDVEFILFEHVDAKNRQSEDWKGRRLPPASEEPELSHDLGTQYALGKDSPYDHKAMFTLIPNSQKQLIEEAKLLEKSNTRRILSHIAWRQPGLPKEQAVWVNFKNMVDRNTILVPNKEDTPTDFLSGEKQFSPYVQGKVKVMLSRYLHVDTDILYFAKPLSLTPIDTENENVTTNSGEMETIQHNSQEPEIFLLKQLRRRMRSKELHYLDHPVLGMLLIITPYEKPETAGETAKKPAAKR